MNWSLAIYRRARRICGRDGTNRDHPWESDPRQELPISTRLLGIDQFVHVIVLPHETFRSSDRQPGSNRGFCQLVALLPVLPPSTRYKSGKRGPASALVGTSTLLCVVGVGLG